MLVCVGSSRGGWIRFDLLTEWDQICMMMMMIQQALMQAKNAFVHTV